MKRSNVMIVKEAALPTDYGQWIQSVKDRVRNAQLRTMVAQKRRKFQARPS